MMFTQKKWAVLWTVTILYDRIVLTYQEPFEISGFQKYDIHYSIVWYEEECNEKNMGCNRSSFGAGRSAGNANKGC
jgi:hydrogenase maturation factor